MKRLHRVLAFGWFWGFVSLAHGAGELQWIPVRLPERIEPNEVFASAEFQLDGDIGWLNTGRKLYVSRDAGRTWKLSFVAAVNRTFYDVHFNDVNIGWAVTGGNRLFHTVDGGMIWDSYNVKVIRTAKEPAFIDEPFLRSVYFKNREEGVGVFGIPSAIFAEGSIVARTKDGGKSWTEVWAIKGATYGQLVGFGNKIWPQYENSDFFTSDFGDHIRQVPLLPFRVDFLSSGYGWGGDYAENESGNWEIYTTQDGGNTWSDPILSLPAKLLRSRLYLRLLSENRGIVFWALENSVVLYLTIDGGRAWSVLPVPAGADYELACNREKGEMWLFPVRAEVLPGWPPSSETRDRLYFASISSITPVRPYGQLSTTWAHLKER